MIHDFLYHLFEIFFHKLLNLYHFYVYNNDKLLLLTQLKKEIFHIYIYIIFLYYNKKQVIELIK